MNKQAKQDKENVSRFFDLDTTHLTNGSFRRLTQAFNEKVCVKFSDEFLAWLRTARHIYRDPILQAMKDYLVYGVYEFADKLNKLTFTGEIYK